MDKSNLNWENSRLYVLANIGDVNLFEYWIKNKKLNIDARDEDGDTTLHYATRGGHVDLVIFLLKKKRSSAVIKISSLLCS
jgi:ankyrin repeat protein